MTNMRLTLMRRPKRHNFGSSRRSTICIVYIIKYVATIVELANGLPQTANGLPQTANDHDIYGQSQCLRLSYILLNIGSITK